MVEVSLEDELGTFLNRLSSLLDAEHTDEFVRLFKFPQSSFVTIISTLPLTTETEVRNWYDTTFSQVEILDCHFELLHFYQTGSKIFLQTNFHNQYCYTDTPDQLKALVVRVSMVLDKEQKQWKVLLMHCSVTADKIQEKIQQSFNDPFADE